MKKKLLDYTNWLLDNGRLKTTSQLPPFEDAEMMVNFYLKATNECDQTDNKNDECAKVMGRCVICEHYIQNRIYRIKTK